MQSDHHRKVGLCIRLVWPFRGVAQSGRKFGIGLFVFALAMGLARHTGAQRPEPAMTDSEVEELREAAFVPADRLAAFTRFLDVRAKGIQELAGKPHRPGRDEDFHDLFEQFTSIVNELNDNLDDYGPRHRDLRKALPKLLQATDRWSTALRTPEDKDVYKTSRDLALEAVRDTRDEAARLIEEQRAWFAAHPEAAKAKQDERR